MLDPLFPEPENFSRLSQLIVNPRPTIISSPRSKGSPKLPPNHRDCPRLTDDLWLQVGVMRTVTLCDSGRDLRQQLADREDIDLLISTFFESPKSGRRAGLLRDVPDSLRQRADAILPDPFAAFPELDGIHIRADDGHFIQPAAHDPREPDGPRFPVGHLYTLNLRDHTANYFCVSDQAARRQEHDMRALKRQNLATLRQGARKGEKVLYVWDKAGYSGPQWDEWRRRGGIHFLSRQKDNLALRVETAHPVDSANPLNWGVRSDEDAIDSGGRKLRRIVIHEKESGRDYTYLTNFGRKIRPGVIALLYKSRRNIKKVFDEFKNKLGETKAWATTATAKTVQARFLCLAHNLMPLLEEKIRRETGIDNVAEIRRRAGETAKRDRSLRAAGSSGIQFHTPDGPAVHPAGREVHPVVAPSFGLPASLERSLGTPRQDLRRLMSTSLDTDGSTPFLNASIRNAVIQQLQD